MSPLRSFSPLECSEGVNPIQTARLWAFLSFDNSSASRSTLFSESFFCRSKPVMPHPYTYLVGCGRERASPVIMSSVTALIERSWMSNPAEALIFGIGPLP